MILALSPQDCLPGDVIVGGPYGPERTVIERFRPSRRDNTVSLTHFEAGRTLDHYYDLSEVVAVSRRQNVSTFPGEPARVIPGQLTLC